MSADYVASSTSCSVDILRAATRTAFAAAPHRRSTLPPWHGRHGWGLQYTVWKLFLRRMTENERTPCSRVATLFVSISHLGCPAFSSCRALAWVRLHEGGERTLREKGGRGGKGGRSYLVGQPSCSTDRIPASSFYILSLIKYGVGSHKNKAPT